MLLLAAAASAAPLGTAFTYQGRLTDNGASATGAYDLQFLLFDALAAGNQQGLTLQRSGVGVANGLFTVTLDFGQNIFTGSAAWLEVRVSPANLGNYTALTPRQAVTPAPYALWAGREVYFPGSRRFERRPLSEGSARRCSRSARSSAGRMMRLPDDARVHQHVAAGRFLVELRAIEVHGGLEQPHEFLPGRMAGLVDDEAKGLQVLFFEPLQIAHERVPRMDVSEAPSGSA
jgi:hypothetical protein